MKRIISQCFPSLTSRTFSRYFMNLREVLAIVVRNNVQIILWRKETNIFTKRQSQQRQVKPTLFLGKAFYRSCTWISINADVYINEETIFVVQLTQCTAILDQVGRRMWTDRILFFSYWIYLVLFTVWWSDLSVIHWKLKRMTKSFVGPR